MGDSAFARFLTSVFSYMALGLVIAGLVGAFVGTSPALMAAIFGNTVLKWVVLLLPLALVFIIGPVVAFGVSMTDWASRVYAVSWFRKDNLDNPYFDNNIKIKNYNIALYWPTS